jgi:hypothetical protein
MRTDEFDVARESRRQFLANAGFDASGIGDQGSGPRGGGGLADAGDNPVHRRTEDDEVSAGGRGRKIDESFVDHTQAARLVQPFGVPSHTEDHAGSPAGLYGQRDRAPDQTHTDNCNRLEIVRC